MRHDGVLEEHPASDLLLSPLFRCLHLLLGLEATMAVLMAATTACGFCLVSSSSILLYYGSFALVITKGNETKQLLKRLENISKTVNWNRKTAPFGHLSRARMLAKIRMGEWMWMRSFGGCIRTIKSLRSIGDWLIKSVVVMRPHKKEFEFYQIFKSVDDIFLFGNPEV